MKEKVNQIKGQYTEAAMAGGVSQSLGSQMNPFMSIRELTVSGLLAELSSDSSSGHFLLSRRSVHQAF